MFVLRFIFKTLGDQGTFFSFRLMSIISELNFEILDYIQGANIRNFQVFKRLVPGQFKEFYARKYYKMV